MAEGRQLRKGEEKVICLRSGGYVAISCFVTLFILLIKREQETSPPPFIQSPQFSTLDGNAKTFSPSDSVPAVPSSSFDPLTGVKKISASSTLIRCGPFPQKSERLEAISVSFSLHPSVRSLWDWFSHIFFSSLFLNVPFPTPLFSLPTLVGAAQPPYEKFLPMCDRIQGAFTAKVS